MQTDRFLRYSCHLVTAISVQVRGVSVREREKER